VSPKAGLYLHLSNRLEQLADALALVLRHPLCDPFRGEALVVQSRGMERWLTQQLADRLGICANLSFLFPQRFVAGLFDEALPGKSNTPFYAPDTLTWRIMKLLPSLVRQKEFAELRHYLDQPRPELRLFQLAEKIAHSFDRYLAFRPEMILRWERRAEKEWQAILWRELVESAPGLHPPALSQEFRALLREDAAPLPERVAWFGI
jgi:exodeoxyribonuclease V gamma subunit